MAKKKKGIYFDKFMASEYDPDALVQDYKGNILLPVAGHVYVIRTFFGLYRIVHDEKKNANSKIKRSWALKFRMPFSQVKLIKNVPTVEKMVINDPILSNDQINAIPAPGGFDFSYEIIDDKGNYKNLYNLNKDAMKGVKSDIQKIIGLIINRGNLNQVTKTFNIDFSTVDFVNKNPQWPSWIKDPDDVKLLNKMYKEIENKYGIKVTEIKTVDFNAPARIVKANEELIAAKAEAETAEIRRKQTVADNSVAIAKAADEALIRVEEARKKAEYDTKKEAEIAAAKANAEVSKQSSILNDRIAALLQYGKDNKLSETQMIKMITCVLNPNATHVDLDGAAAILKALDTNKRNVQSTTNNQQPVAQPTAQPSAQAQHAPAQAQQATAQAQQATAQAQQATAQAQQDSNNVVDDQKVQTSAVDSALNNKKVVRITSANRVPKKSRTDRRGGARRGRTQTPRRQHSHNLNPNAGNGMSRR